MLHGKLNSWIASLNQLPDLQPAKTHLGDTIQIGTSSDLPRDAGDVLDHVINSLVPWRKGPLDLFGREIDTEWRSDMKWHRLRDHIEWRSKSVLEDFAPSMPGRSSCLVLTGIFCTSYKQRWSIGLLERQTWFFPCVLIVAAFMTNSTSWFRWA
ncbi:MAG: DUF1698 domain-containing protein [Pseudomonadales bacterium]|nr:DUF1698 domain-containing protein [Pseudomonadales bacterium]